MGNRTSGGEIIGIVKNFKDADPVDSHHAPEWTERHKSRIEGLRSRLLLWRLSQGSMENIYMLLFMYVGNGTQLALCNVGWLSPPEGLVETTKY